MDYEVPVQNSAGAVGRACARPDPTDLPSAGGGDRTGSGIARPHPHAAVGTTASGAGETGAIHQRAVVTKAAGGVPGTEKTLLGAAPLGPRVLLRDGGRGGRSDDQSLGRASCRERV